MLFCQMETASVVSTASLNTRRPASNAVGSKNVIHSRVMDGFNISKSPAAVFANNSVAFSVQLRAGESSSRSLISIQENTDAGMVVLSG